MKALVISDSHGYVVNLYKALNNEPECKTVFFLGDGLSEVRKAEKDFADRNFICVKGNNDWSEEGEDFAYKYLDGCTIVATHGHRVSVRYGLNDLINKTASVKGNVALYGHTHIPAIDSDSSKEIYLVNPGALCDGRYGVIEINKGDCVATLKTVDF